jgi:co-chaperonin GroES (HSP10)
MKCPTRIIIRLEKTHQEEIDFNGGKLWLDTSYKPQENVFPYAEVVATPERDPYLSDDFVCNVQVGDRLYFNYGIVEDTTNFLGDNLWVIDYYQALAVVRGGKIIPVGEHILIEVEEEEVKSTLIIPETAKKKRKTQGRVFASNDESIPAGSVVMFEERGMFENKIEGNNLYVMYNENILGILN